MTKASEQNSKSGMFKFLKLCGLVLNNSALTSFMVQMSHIFVHYNCLFNAECENLYKHFFILRKINTINYQK